jgi:hypothetical protein
MIEQDAKASQRISAAMTSIISFAVCPLLHVEGRLNNVTLQ